jgi:FtsZ-interacting cell division protein ZipA
MDSAAIVAIVVIAALALMLLVGVWFYSSKSKSKRLREHYGPEYEHLSDQDGRRHAERELQQREKRVEKLSIKELEPADRDRFANDWHDVQGKFVDDPRRAIVDADELVQKVMNARGYPMADFDQRAADVSVDHAEVVRNYRAGHDISEASRKGEATTEQLRQGMLHYRALFDDLLGAAAAQR